MKNTVTVLKLWVAAAGATCVMAGTASATSLVNGSFTLPYEVHWGKAILPAGSYTISMDSVRGPAIIRTVSGEGRALVLALPVAAALKDQPAALLITQRENQRFVQSLNWPRTNMLFVYAPLAKADRKLAGTLDRTHTVPVLVAQK